MSTQEKKELFTHKVVAGGRTYFFDVRETKEGVKYLVISESKQEGSSYAHRRVMVFEENLQAFADGLQKALNFLKAKPELSSIEKVRQRYPRAYNRWSDEEDEQLKVKWQAGMSIRELASYCQRQPSAVRSRLIKLGLLPAQGKTE